MFNRNPTDKALSPSASAEPIGAPGAAGNCSGAAVTKKQPTKQAFLVSMLKSEDGVPLTAIVEATGWLPHTARAALTGLRKKGYAIVRTKIDSETRYIISAATK